MRGGAVDESHAIVAFFSALAPKIIEGCNRCITALFDWVVLLIERQKARADRKVEDIKSGK